MIAEINSIFTEVGFDFVTTRSETEHYNFDQLNVIKDHPSRDMQEYFLVQVTRRVSELTVLRTLQVQYKPVYGKS